MFSCKFCEISKSTFFTEHLWTTVSDVSSEMIQICRLFSQTGIWNCLVICNDADYHCANTYLIMSLIRVYVLHYFYYSILRNNYISQSLISRRSKIGDRDREQCLSIILAFFLKSVKNERHL